MTWTPDRPTKPGKYWLARRGDAVRVVEITPGGFVWDVPETSWEEEIEADYFAGALWRPYVEPADPFAEPVPSLRSRIEALPDLVLAHDQRSDDGRSQVSEIHHPRPPTARLALTRKNSDPAAVIFFSLALAGKVWQ